MANTGSNILLPNKMATPYRTCNVQHALIRYAICVFVLAKVVGHFINVNYGNNGCPPEYVVHVGTPLER